MLPKDYLDAAERFDRRTFEQFKQMHERAYQDAMFLHYVLGLGTEVGEIQDIAKRYLAYGKPHDLANLKEELGDLLWYVARICSLYNLTLESIMQTNINKLTVRYGDKFTEEAALNRDLAKEQVSLEGS